MFPLSWRKLIKSALRSSRVHYHREYVKRRPSYRLLLEPLEDRTAPATLDIAAGGKLLYTADAGVANNLIISLATGTYTFADTETINLTTSAVTAGFAHPGSPADLHTVTGPKSAVNSLNINWADKSEMLTLGSFDASIAPLTATGGGGGSDTAVIAAGGAGVTIAGNISISGFGSIQVNNQIQTTSSGTVTLAAGGSLSFMAAGTITSAGTVSLTSGAGATLSNLTTAGNLVVITNGKLMQMPGTGVTVTGTTMLTAGTANDITLDSGTNDFMDAVTVASGDNVTLQDMNALKLGNLTVSGTLTVTTGGKLSQMAGTGVSVTGTTMLTAGAANDITLDSGSNDFMDAVTVASGDNVTLQDMNALKLGNLTVSGQLFVVTSNGDLTQSATSNILVMGTTMLTAGPTHEITLANSGNHFTGAVSITNGKDVMLKDSSDFVLGPSQVSGGLTICAGGNLTVGKIKASGQIVRLQAGGTVMQTDIITADSLGIQAGDAITLTLANSVATFAAQDSGAGKDIQFSNDIPLQVSAVSIDPCFTGATGVMTTTSGNVTLQANGTLTVGDAIATSGGDVTLCNSAGNLLLNDTVNAGGGKVRLSSASGVQQITGALITAAQLGVLAAGDIKLDVAANQVPIFAANNTGLGSGIHFQAAADLMVNSVSSVPCFGGATGVSTVKGDITVTTGDSMTIAASVMTGSKGDIVLSSGNTMTLAANVATGTGTVQLIANAGGVNQTGGALTAGSLVLLGKGTYSFMFGPTSNEVQTLAASVNGSITYQNLTALDVGNLSGADGVTTSGNDLTLCTVTGDLTIDSPINVGSANVHLSSAGAVKQMVVPRMADTITAGQLGVLAAGNVMLDSVANGVPIFAANNSGPGNFINFLAAGDLKIDSVSTVPCFGGATGVTTTMGEIAVTGGGKMTVMMNVATGITPINSAGNVALTSGDTMNVAASVMTGSSGTIALTSGDMMTLAADLATATGTVKLKANAGGVTQTTGNITAASLLLLGMGSYKFKVDPTGNDVQSLAALVNGSILYQNLTALDVAAVGCANGVSTMGGDLTLCTTSGDLTLDAPIDAEMGTVRLAAEAGAVIQEIVPKKNNTITAGQLGVLAAGAITLDPVANGVSMFAAQSSGIGDSIRFLNSPGFTVAAVSMADCFAGAAGVTTMNGDIALSGGGLVTLGDGTIPPPAQTLAAGTATVTLNAGGVSEKVNFTLTAAKLLLTGGGDFALIQSGNHVQFLAAFVTGAINYRDSGSLTVGSVGGVNGITTNGGDLSLQSAGLLMLGDATPTSQNVTLGGGTATLSSTGGVTENTNSNLTAANLFLQGTGSFILGNATFTPTAFLNHVDTLAASVTGPITYQDVSSFTVGIVNGTAGISTSGGSIIFNLGQSLTVNQKINTVSGALSGAFVANVGQSISSQNSIHADINTGAVPITIQGGANRDDFIVLPSMETPIYIFGGEPTISEPAKLPGDSLALFFQDFSKSGPVVSNLKYMPEPDLAVNPISNPGGILNPRGMFTSNHAAILYFGIENIGGLTLKAFSTQVAPQVSPQQFEIGVSASLFSRDGTQMALQTLPVVPPNPPNPFIFAPQYVDPATSFSAPSLAVGDINGDGTPDVIVGNGPGQEPFVTVFDVRSLFNPDGFTGASPILAHFLAYDSRFRGGVWVAAGNLDEPNRADIVTGPGGGVGSQPLVEVFQNIGSGESVNMQLRPNNSSFFAYESTFTGGVRVAVGNVIVGTGSDIVTAPGNGHAPIVNVFDASGTVLLKSFPAYNPFDPRFMSGVYIATGDYNQDHSDDILTGPGVGSPSIVEVFSGLELSMAKATTLTFNDASKDLLANFTAFLPPVSGASPATTLFPDDSKWISGVSGVAFGNRFGNYLEIVVGSGVGQSTHVRVIITDTGSSTPPDYTQLQVTGGHVFFYRDFDFQKDFDNLNIPLTAFGAFVGAFGAPFAF